MKTVLSCLVVCSTLVLPLAAFAQSADAKYCEALGVEFRKLNNSTSGVEADAIAKCKAGDTATGIPILEKALKDNKVSLPPRG